MNSFHHSIRNLITKVLVTGFAFLIFLFIPKFIGPELFGNFCFLSAFVGLLIPLTSLGLGSGITYSIGSKRFLAEDVMATVFKVAICIASINVLILFLFYTFNWFHYFDQKIQFSFAILMSVGIFFQSLSFLINRVLFGTSEFKVLNIIELISTILNPIVLLGFMLYLGKENMNFIYLSYCLFSILIFILNFTVVSKYHFFKKMDIPFINESLKYGLKSWPGDLALRANLRLDQLIIAANVSSASLGIYSIAVRLAELIWIIPDAIGPVLFNRMASEKNSANAIELIVRIHRILFYACFLVMLFWYLFCTYFIIPWFLGKEFESAAMLMFILAPGILFLISSKVLTKLFSGSGNVQWTTLITLFGSFISIIAYLLLIPGYGMVGAAIASSIGYFCFALAGAIIMKLKYNIPIKVYFRFSFEDFKWLKNEYSKWTYSLQMNPKPTEDHERN